MSSSLRSQEKLKNALKHANETLEEALEMMYVVERMQFETDKAKWRRVMEQIRRNDNKIFRFLEEHMQKTQETLSLETANWVKRFTYCKEDDLEDAQRILNGLKVEFEEKNCKILEDAIDSYYKNLLDKIAAERAALRCDTTAAAVAVGREEQLAPVADEGHAFHSEAFVRKVLAVPVETRREALRCETTADVRKDSTAPVANERATACEFVAQKHPAPVADDDGVATAFGCNSGAAENLAPIADASNAGISRYVKTAREEAEERATGLSLSKPKKSPLADLFD